MPYVYLSVLLMSISTGLLTTLTPSSHTGAWVGYQLLFGLGAGSAFQIPQIAAQVVLPATEDIAVGVSITLFATMLGGAVFVSVGNNVLNTQLVVNLAALDISGLDPQVVVAAGATRLRGLVPASELQRVVEAYNAAVVKTFQVALVMACLSVLGAAGMEWRSVKGGGQQQEQQQGDAEKEGAENGNKVEEEGAAT